MQFLNAKLRALVALCLVALVGVAGCKPSQSPVSESAIAAAIEVAKSETPDSRVHVLSHKFAATGDNPAGWKIDPTTGNLVAPSGKVLEGLSYKNSVSATAIVNQATLTGLAQTIDTIALSADLMRVNLWNQTTTAEKGCWVVHSSAWTRCPDFAAGSSAFGSYFASGGSANKGVYLVTAPAAGSDLVGTANLTAVNLASGGGAVSSVNGQTGAVVLTSADIGLPTIVAMTRAALPASTYANGTAGVGATLTANANGAFGTVDGATVALNDRLANQNDTGVANGIYKLTDAGSGGTPWILTRDVAFDTAAEIQGASFLVKDGQLHGGGTYRYPPASTYPLTIGTSTFFANRANLTNSPLEGFSCTDELTMVTAPAANVSWPGPCGLDVSSNTVSITVGGNGSGFFGSLSLLTANTAVAFGGVAASTSASAASGFTFTLDTNMRSEFRMRSQIPTTSNGTNRYAVNVGFSHEVGASQVVPANGMLFVYDDATSANWKACCSTASTPVCVDTGVVVAATTTYNFHAVHEAAAPNVFFDINGSTPVSVAWSACPAGVLVEPLNEAFNSIGTTNANRGVVVDSVHFSGFYPLLR